MPTVSVNGISIVFEERGQGEPLVLIMGLGAPGSKWENHLRVFERYFRCITLDNRGAGLSDKPEGPYTTKMMAEDTASLMDELGIGSAHVAGVSMGSAIAQHLTLAHPDKVRKLVLISSWACCDEYTKSVFDHFRRVREFVPLPEFRKLVQLWIYSPSYYEANLADMLKGQEDAILNPVPQYAFAAQCEACITHDTLDLLGEIHHPTLITVGDADIFTPARLSKEIHQRIPNSELAVFEGRGHDHAWEAVDDFTGKVLDFLLKT